MPRAPFAVQAYQHRTLPISAQRLINWFPEAQPADAKTRVALLPTPGLVEFATVASNGARGMIVMREFLFAVFGQRLYKIDANGTPEEIGAIPGAETIEMATNGTQVIIVVPETGEAFVATTSAFEKITHSAYNPSGSVAVLDGMAVFAEKNSQRFFLSAINDATTFDPLDFASAEASWDNVLAVRRIGRALWLFGERTTEIWQNVGGSGQFPFLRATAGVIDRGCSARHSAASFQNVATWLGDDRAVYLAQEADVRRISTQALEQEWRSYPNVSNAVAFTYEAEGHTFYILTFPDAQRTFAFDYSTGTWHERESEGYPGWRGLVGCDYAGATMVGDALGNKIWRVDNAAYSDGGAEIRRVATSAPIHSDGKMMRFGMLEADIETGTGLPHGQGSNPKIWLQFSDDGGRTWSEEKWNDIGKVGEYWRVVRWYQLGCARQRCFRLGMADPVRTSILAANIEFDAGAI